MRKGKKGWRVGDGVGCGSVGDGRRWRVGDVGGDGRIGREWEMVEGKIMVESGRGWSVGDSEG